ncbi:hypothetical protein BWI93_22175 [Siphonobacter sp. BAB-5385]|uniref:hypothetical protein n=1 Tax=Siphonobacter sp. BAB-5385 TaxID=1864822 RepID=UPI000B9ECAC6|nr:hypothetical protein [Siphonobacter sp. BAB-5385]OZI05995.1 hypothetical protein BWI93_22175 [Siphonobacter sp. BAB-5385]
MKKVFYRLTTLLSLALLGIGFGCENPFEGIEFQFKDPLTQATLHIQYTDASAGSRIKTPPNLQVAVVGEDANRVKNLTGGELIKPSSEGFLGLAVDPDQLPSSQNPVTVAVWAQADGYLSRLTEWQLNTPDNVNTTVPLISASQPPAGIAASQQDHSTGAHTVQTTAINGANAQWSLPQNTSLSTADGQNARGETKTTLYYYTPQAATTYLPNRSLRSFNAIGQNGQKLPAFLFQGLVFFQLEGFTREGQVLRRTSAPTEVTVAIQPNQRLLNGQVPKEGDSLPFWMFDVTRNAWVQQASLRLQRNPQNNQLFIKTQLSQLTHYALAETQEICENGPTFRFQTNLSGVDIRYYARLVDAATNQTVYETYVDLNNGAQRTFSGMIQRTVKLQVFRANNHTGGDQITPIYVSEAVDLCDTRTITAPISFATPPTKVSLIFDVTCPEGRQVDEAKLPAELRIQYQIVGTEDWVDLITMTRTVRAVASNRLEIGKRYRFRATPNPAIGWPFTQKDTTLRQAVYRLDIQSDTFCR